MRRRGRIWKFVPRNDYRIRLCIAICAKSIMDFGEFIPDSFEILISDRSSSINLSCSHTHAFFFFFIYSSPV